MVKTFILASVSAGIFAAAVAAAITSATAPPVDTTEPPTYTTAPPAYTTAPPAYTTVAPKCVKKGEQCSLNGTECCENLECVSQGVYDYTHSSCEPVKVYTTAPPAYTTVAPKPPSEGSLNVGTVACLSADARNHLVQTFQEKAKAMNKYHHVASCFEQQLIEMTGNSSSNLGVEVPVCMDQSQIIDALMNCAKKMDPEDMPQDRGAIGSASTTDTVPTTQRTALWKGARRKSIRDIFPTSRQFHDTIAGGGRKYLWCDRNFPCCLFASSDYVLTCLKHNCVHYPLWC